MSELEFKSKNCDVKAEVYPCGTDLTITVKGPNGLWKPIKIELNRGQSIELASTIFAQVEGKNG